MKPRFFSVLPVLAAAMFFCGIFSSVARSAEAAPPAMYIMAHQDDEIFIIAKIALDARNGRETHVLWVTDGSGTASPEAREKESRNAMKLAGVPDENLHFLGYQDRYSYKNLDAIYADVMKIAEKLQPSEITTDAYEGGNIDHDVTSLIGSMVAARLASKPAHYEFPLYNMYNKTYRAGKFLPRGDSPTLITGLDDELAAIKLRSLDMYPTQAAIINMIKAVTNKKKIMKDGEIYRVSPKYDYTKRPVEEPLNYEVNSLTPVLFDEWLSYVEPFIKKTRR